MIGCGASDYLKVSMRIHASGGQGFWKWGSSAITFAIISISHLLSFLTL
jgi:hypothetical protein